MELHELNEESRNQLKAIFKHLQERHTIRKSNFELAAIAANFLREISDHLYKIQEHQREIKSHLSGIEMNTRRGP